MVAAVTAPDWYRTAVFYEVLVRAFADSSGTGSGDLRGVIDHLDYLADLGVDCLWLPPFYPSPLRDGGYDVANYTAIAPQYGTLDDFAELIEKAHARGLRVVIDLVMNHTSDAHPWFQASRNDPDGEFGDFYVWRDDDSEYSEARIIFIDTEKSNWTYDEARGQYFWHRFFSHQPDLNFENPAVQEAMLDVARFWLDLGIDGFRLDAVPYLFEAPGTNGENLPATHEFLAKLRKMIDTEYPGRIMIAEANQWPADVVEYFGTEKDPECHICFHFPVMPRIFYALRDHNAQAIRDIMAQTPQIPTSTGQWSTFLRNHDELTLEMVSDDERAAMYQWYAPEPRMRANVGIRRRLSPLLNDDRGELELAHVLLFSLPGSPCLYYGDEIQMGDDIWAPDRDGVRTPMQWTDGHNAGFSEADPQQLYQPVLDDGSRSYRQRNVAAALADPDSLLHWLRRTMEIRRAHPVFGTGEYLNCPSSNPAVLAFIRRDPSGAGETILVLANLAASPQEAVIELAQYPGVSPTVLLGKTADVGEVDSHGQLAVSLPMHGYSWLALPVAHEQ